MQQELTLAQQLLIGATAFGLLGLLAGFLAADFFKPRKKSEE